MGYVLGKWKNVCVQGVGTGLLRLESREVGHWIALYANLSVGETVQEKASAAVDAIKENPEAAAGAVFTAAASSAVKSIAVALGGDRRVVSRQKVFENDFAEEFLQTFSETSELEMKKRLIFEKKLGDLTKCSLSGNAVSIEIGQNYRLTFEDKKSGENMSREFFEKLGRVREEMKSARIKQNIDWTLDANGLLTINGWGKMPDWEYNYGYHKIDTPWYEHRNDIKEVHISAGFVNIGDSAFEDCQNLTSVVIPNSVVSIGSQAFDGCESLTNIVIPDSVVSIGSRAFDGCESLTNIVIPDSVTVIGYSAFGDCENLTNIHILDGVTEIGNYAFENCKNLTSIHIPVSVTSIGWSAFQNCKNLTRIHIPNGVAEIKRNTFYGCENLRNIKIPNSVTSIGDDAFSECNSLIEISIPNSVKTLGRGVFSKCKKLNRVYMPARFDSPLFSIRFGISKEKVTFIK